MTELTEVVESPERPLVVVLGGAKVSDKVGVIDRFLEVADQILIGGAMCFSFFRAQGIETGDSLVEEEGVELAARGAGAGRGRPTASCCCRSTWSSAASFDADTERRESDGVEVPDGWMGLDIGPRTRRALRRGGRRRPAPCSGTGRWAPSRWSRSPPAPAPSPRRSPRRRARPWSAAATRVAALHQFGLDDKVDWLSTGGGASLELLEGKKLPGVEALLDAEEETAMPERTPVHRRQLEDEQDRRRGGRVRRRAAAADRRDPVRRRRLRAVHRADRGGRAALRHRGQGRRPEHARGGLGRLHRRGLGADAGRARRRGGRPRPLRAAPVLRRDRRGAGPQGAGGAGRRASSRSSASARARRRATRARPRKCWSASCRPTSPASSPATDRARRDRLRADLGDRHRPHRHPRAGPGGVRLHPRRAARRAAPPPTRSASSTAARSSPPTPPSCSRCPTSTAPWSAAPASTPRTSPRSSTRRADPVSRSSPRWR